VLTPYAGPALIVVTTIVAMRAFVFTDLLTNQHPDILAQWLPRYCYLGQELAQGRIPQWNPHQMAGMPYASDPQSGWLYAPAMLLFSLASCGRALGWFIALQPLMAGLGLWWFLRREGLTRTAATAGGLSLAMFIAGSSVAVSLPFAGMLAWTPLLLVAASGYFGATSAWRALLWVALGAFAWGQVASAHMSHGLFMATLLLVCYAGFRAAREVKAGRRSPVVAVGMALVFLAFLPLLNAAIFFPRLALMSYTSLRDGYTSLGKYLADVASVDERPIVEHGVWSGWPLSLGMTPGAYAGAAILLAIPAALRTHGKRWLVAAFATAALLIWVLTLDAVVTWEPLRNLLERMPFGDVYLHNPGRLRYLIPIIAAGLGALGIHGMMERPLDRRGAIRWVGAGAAVFLALPMLLGGILVRYAPVAVAMAVTAPLLVALARDRPEGTRLTGTRMRWAVPMVLAVDLLASAVWGSFYVGGTVRSGLEPPEQRNLSWGPLRWPDIPASEYLAPTPLVQTLRKYPDARFMTWYPPAAFFRKGYLFKLANSRAMLFGLDDSMGYSPVQLSRYWSFVRATNRLPIYYNAALLQEPELPDLRLLGVRFMIVPSYLVPDRLLNGRFMDSDGRFTLWQIGGHEPRASVVPAFHVMSKGAHALLYVLQPAYDPKRDAYVEQDPGITRVAGSPDEGGTATYEEVTPERVEMDVQANAPSIVVIRNAWDRNWEVTVDGEPGEVLRTDYFLQGVPVGAGSHHLVLTYHDPEIFQGLWLSALSWGVLAVAVGGLAGWEVVRRRRSKAAPDGG
jgi:hypothetical protein